MELPLVNDSSFTPAHPASYSLEDFWPIGEHSSLRNRDEVSTVTDQSMSNNGGRKKRVLQVVLNPNTCSAAEHLHESNSKKVKVLEVKEETRILQDEEDDTSFTGAKHGKQKKKLPDPSKQDYIHVRARRGQATDSHSLAERARREKISERMKILQDLVPGCNKIIGKALVLDEIINYVLSLQNQVEFISMKLEAINSSIVPKDMMLPTKNLKTSGVDTAGITFHAHPTNKYAQGPQ